MKKILSLLCLSLCALASIAQANLKPLSADRAFQLSASTKDNQTAIVRFIIAPQYYLYRNKIAFSTVKLGSAVIATPLLPPGTQKYNPTIGHYMALQGQIQFALPILSYQQANLPIRVHYQGCSSEGFCYPPMSKVVILNLTGPYNQWSKPINLDIPQKIKSPATEPNDRISQILANSNVAWVIAAFFGFGVLISLTPCILPMIPILSSIIIGHSRNGPLSHLRSFMLSLSYVLGMAITYAIAGMIFGYLGSNIQAALQIPWVIIVFAMIFILLALSMFGYYNIQLPSRWQTKLNHSSGQQKHGSYIGVALMGSLSSLVLSPCVTPPLVGALGFISRTGNSLLGGSALFALGFGMGLPLLFIGATSAKLLPKAGPWMNAIKKMLGVLLLAVAISLLSRIIPAWANMGLWTALIIGCSYALGAFKSADGLSQRLCKILGVLFFIYGIVLLIGLYQGNTNPLQPISKNTTNSIAQDRFIRVTSMDELNHQLDIAQKNQQPVLLDFSADWCIACKQMAAFTLNNSHVLKALKPYRLIKVDVTNNDDNSKALQQHYGVIAPPTLIFIDQTGKELKSQRIIGEISAADFLQQLQNIAR